MSETSMKKGFGMTIGVVFALFVVFVILPFGACVGCTMCAGATAGMQEAQKKEEVAKLGPELTLTGLTYKINDSSKHWAKVSYKFTVTNNRDRNLIESFDVKFQDKDGLEVDKDLVLSETILAGESKDITGMATMRAEDGVNIATMDVVIR